MPMQAFERSKSVPSPPACARWESDRAWLSSTSEIESIAAFLSKRPWTFQVRGVALFSGYSQSWCIVLAALLYVRGRAHKDALSNTPCPNWARSGQDEAHQRALNLEFSLPSASVIALLADFKRYLENIRASQQYPGLPPSLLYSRFDTRIEYIRCLLNPVPELVALLHVVIRMVSLPCSHI